MKTEPGASATGASSDRFCWGDRETSEYTRLHHAPLAVLAMPLRFAFDRGERVVGRGVESLQLEDREAASLLRGMDEGEDDRLALVVAHGFRGGELAAVARRDEAVEIALHDRRLHLLVGGDQALCCGDVVGVPFLEIGADAERALHGGEEAVLDGGVRLFSQCGESVTQAIMTCGV